MNPSIIFIGIPMILITLAALTAAAVFVFKTLRGREKKANSTHRFFKTKSSDLDELLNADRAELLKNLWVRQFDASVKPTERVKKGIYPVRGVAKDTEENLLIFLEIAGVLKLVRYTKENVKLSAKADDEPDDEADEDE